ncbi:MAG: hypothetical protein R3Y49_03180 [Rikenellaceae bacterium]
MDSITTLKQSVTKLLEQIERLKKQNSQLNAHVSAAEARAKRAEEKNAELNEQLGALLLGTTLTQVAGGSRAAKMRITKLIKEVDKCIAMSSK